MRYLFVITCIFIFSTSYANESRTPILVNEDGDSSHVITNVYSNTKGQLIVTTGGGSVVAYTATGVRLRNLKSISEYTGLSRYPLITVLDDETLILTQDEQISLIDFEGNILSKTTLGRGKSLYVNPVVVDKNNIVVISNYASPLTGRHSLYANIFLIEQDRKLKYIKKVNLGDISFSYQNAPVTKDGKIIFRQNNMLWSFDTKAEKIKKIFEYSDIHRSIMEHEVTASDSIFILSYDGELCKINNSSTSCIFTGSSYMSADGILETSNGDLIVNLEDRLVRYTSELNEVWSLETKPNPIERIAVIRNTLVGTVYSFNLKDNPELRFDLVAADINTGSVVSKINHPQIFGIMTAPVAYGTSELVIGDNTGYIRFMNLNTN